MRTSIALSALIGVSTARNCESGRYSITNHYTRFSQAQQDIQTTNDQDCWEKWTGWSACEGLCGQAVKTASRLCRGGIPGETSGCDGKEIRRKRCAASERVYGQATETNCPYYSFWAEWTSCHVEKNPDPCVQPNTQGTRQRTRTCHDPYATLKGETPDCSGLGKNGVELVEYSSCVNPSAYGKTPLRTPIYAPNSDWSQCSANCGSGRQTRTLAHQCANRDDTWVPRDEWFKQEEQVCVGPGEAACQCCMAGEWKHERNYDVCTGGSEIMTRIFTSISVQGCRQECFDRIGATEVIFNRNTNQWTETRITYLPIQPNCDGRDQAGVYLTDAEQGWGACIPQPSSWNPSVMTKCEGNGLQRRERRHYCASTCQPGDSECVWLKPPCSVIEERSCGPMRTTEYYVRCSDDIISSNGHYVCERRSFCMGDAASMTVDIIPASNGMCGPHHIPNDVPRTSGPTPAQCSCSTGSKTITTSNNECHTSSQTIMCPPTSDFCAWGEYMEVQLLIQARADGLCVCKYDSRYYDERFEQCTKQAENGEICSSYRTEKRETQVNKYQQDFCPALEIQCEPCSRQCQMPGQAPEARKCWRSNVCNPSDPMDKIYVEDRICPEPEPCCFETYETLVQDCQHYQCPSDPGASTNKQVYEIRYVNPACGSLQVRTREVMCPMPTCPQWPEFTAFEQMWSECSWTLEDGTVCGGNRKQSRRYPCPNDAGPGGACSQIAPNGAIETQYDAHSENHHSQYCWSIYQGEPNMVRVAKYEAWSEWVRVGCENGKKKFERTQTVTNICTGEQMVHLFKTESKYEDVIRPEPIAECCTAESCPGVELNPCAPTVKLTIPSYECNEVYGALDSYSPDVSGMCPVIDSIVRKYDNCDAQRCAKKVGNYIWNNAISEEEYCTGTCTETTEFLCKEAVHTVKSCQVGVCEWGPWGPWRSDTPFEIGVNYQIEVDGRIEDVKCNSCGGQLKQERRQVCCPGQSKIEGRTVECPAPSLVTGPTTPCQQTCQMNKHDKCTEQTCKIAPAGTEHCFNLPQCTHNIVSLPPCQCPEVVQICQHPEDIIANCGMGTYHDQTFTVDCETRARFLGEAVQTIDTGKPCELQYQPISKVSDMFGCTTVEERCLGGNYRRTVQKICPENSRYAFNSPPWTAIEEVTGPCPILDKAYATEWMATEGCHQCGGESQLTRECIGGVFRESCECDVFQTGTPGCCKKDPYSQIDISNPSIEIKAGLRCPISTEVRTWTEKGNCECGICEEHTCSEPICGGKKTCQVTVPGQDPPPTITLSECIYDQVPHRCGVAGYKLQTTTVTCRNNMIVNEVSTTELKQDPRVIGLADPRYYNKYNQQNIVSNGFYECPIIPFTHRTESSNCNYDNDQCNPTRTTYEITECEGNLVDRQTKSMNDITCPAVVVPEWGPWSSCSVECGQGIQTRSKIDRCNPGFIGEQEQRQCGCQMSYWGSWSEVTGTCDPCGDEVQYYSKQRVCGSEGYMPYVYGQLDNGMVGMVGPEYQRRTGSNLPLCPSKCLACTPGQVDIETTEISRDITCPPTISVKQDHCPQKGSPAYCSTYSVQSSTVDQCGRVLNQETIQCRSQKRQCQESECSVPCGPGIKQMRCTDDAECSGVFYNTTTAPCQGKFGKVVPSMSIHETTQCNKECGGGIKYVISYDVCELNMDIKIREKRTPQECNMWPCAYWGIWSDWSMCSTTCGSGQQQRMRLCEGGQPGEGACYQHKETDEVGREFDTQQAGTLHIRSCGMGECCEYDWSGWSNCCLTRNRQEKKIRWKGNCGTQEWSIIEENCVYGEKAKGECNYMNKVNVVTGDETITELHYQWRMGKTWYNVTKSYNRYPAPVNGDYTINGVIYRLQDGQWYIVSQGSQFGLNQLIEVETSQYSANGIQERYFYKFAGQWYQFINNGFQLQSSYVKPSTKKIPSNRYYKPQSTIIGRTQETVYKPNKYLHASTSYIAPVKPATKTTSSSSASLPTTTYNYQKPYAPAPVTPEEKAQYQEAISTVGSSLNPVVQPAAKAETPKVEYISNFKPTNLFGNF
jgi:hypothetical protein